MIKRGLLSIVMSSAKTPVENESQKSNHTTTLPTLLASSTSRACDFTTSRRLARQTMADPQEDDEYFNSLMSRVDRAIAGEIPHRPAFYKQLLSQHSWTGICCKAPYDHLTQSKRRYLLFYSFMSYWLFCGIYSAMLIGGEPITTFDYGGAYFIVTLVFQTFFWLVRSALRRPDKFGPDWYWPSLFFVFLMFTGSTSTWAICSTEKTLIEANWNLFGAVVGTEWLIELLLLVVFIKMDVTILTTVGDNSEYLKEAGIAEDEYVEDYVPPTSDPSTGVMPSTVDL